MGYLSIEQLDPRCLQLVYHNLNLLAEIARLELFRGKAQGKKNNLSSVLWDIAPVVADMDGKSNDVEQLGGAINTHQESLGSTQSGRSYLNPKGNPSDDAVLHAMFADTACLEVLNIDLEELECICEA